MHSLSLRLAAERERHAQETAAILRDGRAEGVATAPFALNEYLDTLHDAGSDLMAAVARAADRQAEDLASDGDGFSRRVSPDRLDHIAYRGL